MWIFCGLMTALVALLLYGHHSGRPRLEWVAKPLAAACFVVPALTLGELGDLWRVLIVVGLCLAAVGDVFLIPKSRRAFLVGLLAFLAGHVAYAAAFVARGIDLRWAAIAAVLVGLFFVPVVRWLWPRVEEKMRRPVAAYIGVIAVMVTLAFGTHGASAALLLVVGAVGFCLSDISVAQDRFVEPRFVNRLWGLPLYFFSQLLLAWAVTS